MKNEKIDSKTKVDNTFFYFFLNLDSAWQNILQSVLERA